MTVPVHPRSMAARRAGLLVLCCSVAALTACAGGEPTATQSASGTSVTSSRTGAPIPTTTTTTTTTAAPTTPPPTAGPSAVEAVEGLPAGVASGTVALTFDGLGGLDAPFAGQCSTDQSGVVIDGTADSASLLLSFTDDTVTLTVEDDGLGRFDSDLGRADVVVDGPTLRLTAQLVQAGQVTGSIELDLTCGG